MEICQIVSLLYQKEKKILETKRLDLDAAKAKLRRAKTQGPGKDNVSIVVFRVPCHCFL